jgi:hypothetical protein
VHLLHAFAFSKKLPWLAQSSEITLKTQQLSLVKKRYNFKKVSKCCDRIQKRMWQETLKTEKNSEVLREKAKCEKLDCLGQWFSTEVPRHTKVM